MYAWHLFVTHDAGLVKLWERPKVEIHLGPLDGLAVIWYILKLHQSALYRIIRVTDFQQSRSHGNLGFAHCTQIRHLWLSLASL